MSDITLEQVRAVLTYNPETGELRWTDSERPRKRSDVAGSKAANGYLMIHFLGKVRLAHRLAWLLHYGQWPSAYIDHVNGDRGDNRLVNLRDVPHAANMRNRKDNRLLVGAIRGENGKWRAAVHQYRESQDLGREFDTPEAANAAWLEAKSWVGNPNTDRPRVRSVSRLDKS